MKILRLAGWALVFGLGFSTVALGALSSGNWTKVEALYTYLGGGAYCGVSWEGITLVETQAGSSNYSGSCEADMAAIDASTPGGQAAISTVLSAHARGAEVKINVDNANFVVCVQDGKTYCKAVQVNAR